MKVGEWGARTLLYEAWRDVDPAQRPGILMAYPFFMDADLDDLLGPVRDYGVRIFADSGAFTAWRSGKTIERDAYVAWLKRWSHLFDVYANLDVIGDVEGTAANQAALEGEGLSPLPTFHFGTTWDHAMPALADRPPYVAFGGMVGRMTHERNEVKRWVLAGFERTQPLGIGVHGFGLTRWDVIADFPWRSCDSTSWQIGSRYGSILLFTPTQGLVQKRAGQLVENLPYIRACGLSLDEAYGATQSEKGHPERRINSALVSLRSLAIAQGAVRRRWRNDDFTIYCAAVLESQGSNYS